MDIYYTIKAETLKIWSVGTWAKARAVYVTNYSF